jgi:rare lipoprotein A
MPTPHRSTAPHDSTHPSHAHPSRALPRTRRSLTHRAAQAGLVSGIAIATAALALPSGSHAATPDPQVTVAAQTAAEPMTVDRRAARASRSRTPAAKRPPLKRVTRTMPIGPSFSGQASWYGGSFQGQRTANGESFDTNDYTAASKTLPFGTRLRVCHDGCVVVRVNDRGPYVGGRILDLSRAAANAIGFDGVAHVTATPVGTRTVRVVDTVALAKLRAQQRRAAALARARALKAEQRARAAALVAAEQQRRAAAVQAEATGPVDQARTPVAAAGSALSLASGGLLRLRRRRP